MNLGHLEGIRLKEQGQKIPWHHVNNQIECLSKLPRILSKLPRLYQKRFLDHLFVIPGTHAVNLSVSHRCRIVLHKQDPTTSYYFQFDVSG